MREVNNAIKHPPNYVVGLYDCMTWRNDVVNTCLKEAKGQCGLQ